MDPPTRYAEWYAEVEACADISGQFDRVNWFMVAGTSWVRVGDDDPEIAGEWWPPHDIYIPEYRIRHGSEDDIVKHQILHELLQSRAHPTPPFDVCAPMSI